MKILFFLFVAILISVPSFGQNLVSAGTLIQGGVDDGEKLLQAYLTPVNKAIVFGMSNATHNTFINENDGKKLSFGLKLAYVIIPKGDLTYDVSNLGMENLEAENPSKTIAQTALGDSLTTITISSKKKNFLGRPLFSFESPAGAQQSGIPLPTFDLNYRLAGTNIAVDFIPYVKIPTTELNLGMLGVSIQQDVASIVSSLKDKPFSISLQGSASFLIANSDLDVKPDGVTVPVTLTGSTTGPYDDQEVNIKYTSIQIGAYFDYKLGKHYSIFAGGAYNLGTSKILVLGKYPIYGEDPSHTGAVVASDIVDPIDISENFNRVKFEVGAMADWKRIFLQLNYNITTYGGVGFNLGYKLF